MNNEMLLARRRIMMTKKSGKAPSTDMVLLINSSNTGDFSVATNYGSFTAVKVSDYSHFDTTVTHKLSISDVTFSTGQSLSNNSAVRGLFVGVESWGTSNTYANASYMFTNCNSLTSIPTSWAGLGELTNAGGMFTRCTSLTSIPTSWEGLGAVTDTSAMFQNCTSITNCGTTFTGLAKVIDVRYLFNGCTGMRGDIHALYVYLSTKPVAVKNFSYCFRNCTQAVGYESIPASWK